MTTIEELELRVSKLEKLLLGSIDTKIVEDEGMKKEEKPAGKRKR